MKRVPVLTTLLVALAVAAMIALGIWQLQRRDQKLALLARYAANRVLPPIPFPRTADPAALFRTATATCTAPVTWTREAGRAADGGSGWRQIARCAGGAGAPTVQFGITSDPHLEPVWPGGTVTGYVTQAPSHRALIVGAFDPTPAPLMLVAATPLPGLKPNPSADLSAVPNNHLAYAVQWFLFAAIAAIIYVLALRRRLRV